MRFAGATLLVALMAVGSIAMWLGVPVFWVWLASQLSTSSQPSASLILLIVVGIAVSVLVMAKLLGRANHAHQALTDDRRDAESTLESKVASVRRLLDEDPDDDAG